MKKNIIVMAMAGVAVLAGCQKEVSSVAPDYNGIVITALSDNEPDAKTTLDDANVLWNNSDEIAVYNGTAVAKFTTAAEDRSATADFTTEDTKFQAAGTYLAVYPYSEGVAFSGDNVAVTVPAEQTACAGSFAKGVNVAVAKGSSDALAFKNVCAYLKFTVPAGMNDLKKVVLAANGESEYLAGKVEVSCENPSYSVTDGEASVTLEGTFEAGKSYYIAVLPQTLSAGFTMTMTRGESESTMKTSKEFTFTRSRTANIGELYDGTWKVSLEGTAVPDGTSIILTQTLENENLFACLEDLKEGELRLKVLYENVYIATQGGNFTDGKAETYTTSSTPCDIAISTAGKYRIVLDKSASTITFYSSATDTPNKKVLFNRTNGVANDNCKEEVSQLWLYGEGFYKKGQASQPIGEPYVLIQSLANPRLFVYSGKTLKSVTIQFLASDNWNNEYMFGSSKTSNSKVSPAIGQTYGPLYGGQGDNRSAKFVIPEGTNYIELFVGAPSSDESTHAFKNAFELEGSYVRFETR